MTFDAPSGESCDGSFCVPHEFTQANRCFLNVFVLCGSRSPHAELRAYVREHVQSARLHAKVTEQGILVVKSNAELDLMRGFRSFFLT